MDTPGEWLERLIEVGHRDELAETLRAILDSGYLGNDELLAIFGPPPAGPEEILGGSNDRVGGTDRAQ